MLNSIRINHARIKFRDQVATVMYERVNGRPTDSIFTGFCSYRIVRVDEVSEIPTDLSLTGRI